MTTIPDYYELDLAIPFWLSGEPYEPSKYRYNNMASINLTIEIRNGERAYITLPIKYAKLYLMAGKDKGGKGEGDKEDSCQWVANYFMALQRRGEDLRIEGRKWYYGCPKPSSIPGRIIPVPPRLSSEIFNIQPYLKYAEQNFDLAKLICQVLSRGGKGAITGASERSISLNILEDLLSSDDCTPIFSRIASSLIKVASTRIFVEPEQSILEPPVNSMDAYRPQQKIGKFGMGFFSFLYWLIGHPKRHLTINSYFVSDGRYGFYTATIRENPRLPGNLTFILKFPESETKLTGTEIYIDANADPFNVQEIRGFHNQISKLAFTASAGLWNVNPLGKKTPEGQVSYLMNAASKTAPLITYWISPIRISIEDYATGLPLDIFLSSLLIPSVSTKTLALATKPTADFVSSGKLEHSNPMIIGVDASLSITVANIAILQFKIKGVKGGVSPPSHYVLSLPPWVVLPVSRDDIILDNDTAKIFEVELVKLYNLALASTNVNDVLNLQNLLGMLELRTSSDRMRKIVGEISNRFAKDHASILVSVESADILRNIVISAASIPNPLTKPKSSKSSITRPFGDPLIIEKTTKTSPVFHPLDFRPSLTVDVLAIEKSLDRIPSRSDIWYGKKVIVTELSSDAPIRSLGLPTYIFVDSKYIHANAFWITTLPNMYLGSALFPISSEGDPTGTTDFDKEIKFERNANYEMNIRAYRSLRLRYERLTVYFSNIDVQRHKFITDLQRLYETIPSIFAQICMTIQSTFSKVKGNATYGGNQYELYFSLDVTAFLDIAKIKSIKTRQHLEELFKQSILLSLSIIEERPKTRLYASVPKAGMANLIGYFPLDFLTKIMADKPNLVYVSFLGYVFIYLKMKDPKPHLIEYFNERFRFYRLDHQSLTSLYQIAAKKSGLSSVAAVKLMEEIQAYDAITKTIVTKIIAKSRIPADKKTYRWKISELMAYLGTHPVDVKKVDFLKLSEQIQKYTEDVKGITEGKDTEPTAKRNQSSGSSRNQLVEIVVNEGTSKPFIPAMITELTQNSVDAIRTFLPSDNTVYIDLSVDSDEKHIWWSIYDKVGMTAEALLAISIPFYSTKQPSETVTGEMGSGFFNVYRESDLVIVRTPVADSWETPIRAKSGRVIDVQKVVCAPSDKKGTSIEVSIPYATEEEKIAKMVEISTWISGVMYLIPVPLEFQGLPVAIEKQILFEDDMFQIFYLPEEATQYAQHVSYLLTKGLPSAPLSGYLPEEWSIEMRDEASSGIFINLKSDSYAPTQSRTRVRMSDALSKRWNDILDRAMFLKALTRVGHKHDTWMLPHWDSIGKSSQLRFASTSLLYMPKANLSVWLMYYQFVEIHEVVPKKLPYRYNLADILNLCITKIDDKPLTDVAILGEVLTQNPTTKKSIKSSLHHNTYSLVLKVLKGWFEKKNTDVKIPISATSLKTPLYVATKNDPRMRLLSRWVNIYWKLAQTAQVVGTVSVKSPIVKIIEGDPKNRGGWYDFKSNSLTIVVGDKKYWSEDNVIGLMDILFAKKKTTGMVLEKLLNGNELWRAYFSLKVPSSIVIHELEHARRHNGHLTSGAHDRISGALVPGDPGPQRNFEESANFVYTAVLGQNLFAVLAS